jgi:hypothetical protein
MSTTIKVTIADDAYERIQSMLGTVSQLLLDPKLGFGKPSLDLFIERAERAESLGPVLHPSEFQIGADKLRLVLVCARAIRDARDQIAKELP